MKRYIKAWSNFYTLGKICTYVKDYLLKHELGQYVNWYKLQYGDELTTSTSLFSGNLDDKFPTITSLVFSPCKDKASQA